MIGKMRIENFTVHPCDLCILRIVLKYSCGKARLTAAIFGRSIRAITSSLQKIISRHLLRLKPLLTNWLKARHLFKVCGPKQT